METLNELFLHILKDAYYAEKAIGKALPKLARNTTAPELAQAFLEHREETMTQIERLEQVFEMCGVRAKGEPCEAIKGLIDEGDEVIEAFAKGPVRDAGLLACAQAVEHYEMGRYGALIAWAEQLGMQEAAELLRTTLAEEQSADGKLSDLAAEQINAAAAGDDDETAADEGAMASARRGAAGRGSRSSAARSAPRRRAG